MPTTSNYSYSHVFLPCIQRELLILTVQFLQVFMLMENYCNVCLYVCIWSATNADIFTCIILSHLNYKLSLSCRRWCFYFEIKYIFILLEWWTTRFKHVVIWLRWFSGQTVWQSVRGLHAGTCWWIALHIFTLTVSVLILEQHSFPMINANEVKYKLDL